MNIKQNIVGKTSLNTKTDKIEKLSKILLFPSSALFYERRSFITKFISTNLYSAMF